MFCLLQQLHNNNSSDQAEIFTKCYSNVSTACLILNIPFLNRLHNFAILATFVDARFSLRKISILAYLGNIRVIKMKFLQHFTSAYLQPNNSNFYNYIIDIAATTE